MHKHNWNMKHVYMKQNEKQFHVSFYKICNKNYKKFKKNIYCSKLVRNLTWNIKEIRNSESVIKIVCGRKTIIKLCLSKKKCNSVIINFEHEKKNTFLNRYKCKKVNIIIKKNH